MAAQEIELPVAERLLVPAFRGGVIVIQAGLADGADARIAGEGEEAGDRIVRRVMDVARMYADASVNRRIFRQIEVGLHILKAGRESHQATYARGARAFEKAGDFRRFETMGGEMAVGIGEHGNQRCKAVRNAATF
jgi:hypothetical protein